MEYPQEGNERNTSLAPYDDLSSDALAPPAYDSPFLSPVPSYGQSTMITYPIVEPKHNHHLRNILSPKDNAKILYTVSANNARLLNSKPHITVKVPTAIHLSPTISSSASNNENQPVGSTYELTDPVGTVVFHHLNQDVNLKVRGKSITMHAVQRTSREDGWVGHQYICLAGPRRGETLLWKRKRVHSGEDLECVDEEGRRIAWYDSEEKLLGVETPEEMLDEIVMGAMAMLEFHRREAHVV